jgi:hypothetical protein
MYAARTSDAQALTTGRPGIYLYVAADPPVQWARFNIAAAHNQQVLDKGLRFDSDIPGTDANGTTSYTGLVLDRKQHASTDRGGVVAQRLEQQHPDRRRSAPDSVHGRHNPNSNMNATYTPAPSVPDSVYVSYDRLGAGCWPSGGLKKGEASAIFVMHLEIF